MIQVGFCKRCDAPVTAYDAEAGAAQMNCEHSPQHDIIWTAPTERDDMNYEPFSKEK